MGPAQTEWTELTAAVHQDLMEPSVKKVSVYFTLYLGDLGLSKLLAFSVIYWHFFKRVWSLFAVVVVDFVFLLQSSMKNNVNRV